uniref:Uncharacterized protein n=1 Tax=Arundo donax TaxID=35708 RepID=A0A0A9BKA8_ARUDO
MQLESFVALSSFFL